MAEERALEVVDSGNVLPANLEEQIQTAKQQNDYLMRLMNELLLKDTDYGRVPGVPKPFLFQPGAQQLCLTFRLAPRFTIESEVIELEKRPYPLISYTFRCDLMRRDTGQYMGSGIGSANSYERKYRYRTDKKTGKQVENNDPMDGQNTLVKMAKKRAFVDASLNVTGASRLFTQDEDYMEGRGNGGQQQSGSGEQSADPPTTLSFGKHKDEKIADVNSNYLEWVLSNFLTDEKLNDDRYGAENRALKTVIEKELASRENGEDEEEQPEETSEAEVMMDEGQRKYVKQLLAMDIDRDTVREVAERHGVTKLKDMTYDQATAFINDLQAYIEDQQAVEDDILDDLGDFPEDDDGGIPF